MIDFKEYTRQRDIAVKRIKRLESKGIKTGIVIPTVKEIKAGKYSAGESMQLVSNYLSQGYSLGKARESRRIHYTQEQKAQRRREYQRDYRRRKVAERLERPEFPNKYRSYLKGLKTMKVDIAPSKLPAFFAYMDYRFSQGDTTQLYVFDIFVGEFQTMLKKGYKPEQILSDLQKFEADQAAIRARDEGMEGITAKEALQMVEAFIKNI